jgi:hypothetical protein
VVVVVADVEGVVDDDGVDDDGGVDDELTAGAWEVEAVVGCATVVPPLSSPPRVIRNTIATAAAAAATSPTTVHLSVLPFAGGGGAAWGGRNSPGGGACPRAGDPATDAPHTPQNDCPAPIGCPFEQNRPFTDLSVSTLPVPPSSTRSKKARVELPFTARRSQTIPTRHREGKPCRGPSGPLS